MHSTGQVKPGDKVLVHTAAGGTGSLVCQMAKNAGNNNNNNIIIITNNGVIWPFNLLIILENSN